MAAKRISELDATASPDKEDAYVATDDASEAETKKMTLAAFFEYMMDTANYERTLNVASALSSTPQSVLIGEQQCGLSVGYNANPEYTITIVGVSAGSLIGFFGGFNGEAAGKQVVTGSKGGNVALGSLIDALKAYGLITDTTS